MTAAARLGRKTLTGRCSWGGTQKPYDGAKRPSVSVHGMP